MWRGGKGILGECVATDEWLIFNKRGFFSTYISGSLVKALIVITREGEEIIFAVSDKHKKWFALMDELVNKC